MRQANTVVSGSVVAMRSEPAIPWGVAAKDCGVSWKVTMHQREMVVVWTLLGPGPVELFSTGVKRQNGKKLTVHKMSRVCKSPSETDCSVLLRRSTGGRSPGEILESI